MRNYWPVIPNLSNNRIDEITYTLLQYDEYREAVESGNSRARYGQFMLDTIEAAVQAIGCPDLIPVCCKKHHRPGQQSSTKQGGCFISHSFESGKFMKFALTVIIMYNKF